MGTIADKLERVLKTKKDIQSALVKNGKYVPDKLPFRYYPDLIDNMNINGLVGMYYGKGLTNEELSKDPTWYDTSGNGNDLKFKNFAWKLDSGAGIYAYDFTIWSRNMGGLTSIEATGSKIQIKAPSNASTGNVYDKVRSIGYNYNFKIKVTGIKSGNKVSIRKGPSSIFVDITQDGVYYINTTVEEDWSQKMLYIFVNSNGGPDVDLIIEQIPDYEGAICFNGIDDCAICDNFPILTKDKGYTVMALRRWISLTSSYPTLISKANNNGSAAFIFEEFYGGWITASYEKATSITINNDLVSWQISNSYNGDSIGIGISTDSDKLVVGRTYFGINNSSYANAAIYALCIIDHDTSDAERQIVINKWKQYYPELFPDQAWTVKGKTNDDEDRATVKNITGNGNDLVLSNFAFTQESGYNSEGYLVTDGVDDSIKSSNFYLYDNFTLIGEWKLLQEEVGKNAGIIKGNKLYIYNTMLGISININSITVSNRLNGIKTLKAICSDGRCYDENWNEIVVNVEEHGRENNSLLLGISSNDKVFAKIAFKNCAFYSNSLLTKDQCIKAYNYLQTFKTK